MEEVKDNNIKLVSPFQKQGKKEEDKLKRKVDKLIRDGRRVLYNVANGDFQQTFTEKSTWKLKLQPNT